MIVERPDGAKRNVMLSLSKHLAHESKSCQLELLPRARCFDKLSMTVLIIYYPQTLTTQFRRRKILRLYIVD